MLKPKLPEVISNLPMSRVPLMEKPPVAVLHYVIAEVEQM